MNLLKVGDRVSWESYEGGEHETIVLVGVIREVTGTYDGEVIYKIKADKHEEGDGTYTVDHGDVRRVKDQPKFKIGQTVFWENYGKEGKLLESGSGVIESFTMKFEDEAPVYKVGNHLVLESEIVYVQVAEKSEHPEFGTW